MSSTENNPHLESLIKDYKECMSKEEACEVWKKTAAQKAKLLIGSSLKDSKLTLSGDQTPQQFKNRIVAAESVRRMTYFADERRRLLSIVAVDYTYRFLQEQFGYSPCTVTAARVHAILFGRGGTSPSNCKFQQQCVSPTVLEELSVLHEEMMCQDLHPVGASLLMIKKLQLGIGKIASRTWLTSTF